VEQHSVLSIVLADLEGPSFVEREKEVVDDDDEDEDDDDEDDDTFKWNCDEKTDVKPNRRFCFSLQDEYANFTSLSQ
jgi:hypothetical protein